MPRCGVVLALLAVLLSTGLADGRLPSQPKRALLAKREDWTDTPAQAAKGVPFRRATAKDGTIIAQVQSALKAKLGQFPYTAALFQGGYAFCSGTLVDPGVVMTAAHCVKDEVGNSIMLDYVKVGGISTSFNAQGSDGGIQRGWKKRVVNAGYDQNSHDVALIFLESNITTIKPVRLAGDGFRVSPWRALTVAGYGNQDNDYNNYDLRMATLQYVPNAQCEKLASYLGPFPLSPTLMCAGYVVTSSDVCSGDSGGPLIIWNKDPAKHIQVGLTHAGLPCGTEQYPLGSYTSVAAEWKWIAATISKYKRRR